MTCQPTLTTIKAVAIAGMALILLLGPARATTKIEGQADSLELRVDNASTQEVLDALSSKFKLTYALPGGAGRQLTGRYSGTLTEVLGRILDGNDYVVELSDDTIKVVVLVGTVSTARAVVPPAGSSKESQTPAAAVMPPEAISRQAPVPSVPPLASYLTLSSMAGSDAAQ